MRIQKRHTWVIFFVVLLFSGYALSSQKHPEKYYQDKWCKENNGKTEVVFSDGSRCDCLTDKYAVEVDFAPKWAEAIGQVLHYAALTGKKPKILLIQHNKKDQVYYDRLMKTIDYWCLQIEVEQLTIHGQPSADAKAMAVQAAGCPY